MAVAFDGGGFTITVSADAPPAISRPAGSGRAESGPLADCALGAALDRFGQGLRHHQALANRRLSNLLLGGMVLVLAACGWMTGGTQGAIRALAEGALPQDWTAQALPNALFGRLGARRIGPGDLPTLFAVLSGVCRRAGLPALPEVYYLDDPSLNAFAIGGPGRCAILVTDGLLRGLGTEELTGVLAHEIGHIRNHDTWAMGLAGRLCHATGAAALLGGLMLLLKLAAQPADERRIPWLRIALLLSAPVISRLLQLALSRIREYDADLAAIELAGQAHGLVAALHKIEGLQAPPGAAPQGQACSAGLSALLRTHPHGHERIRALLALAPGTAPAAV